MDQRGDYQFISRKSKADQTSFYQELQASKWAPNTISALARVARDYILPERFPDEERASRLSQFFKMGKNLSIDIAHLCELINSQHVLKDLIYRVYIHMGTNVIFEITKAMRASSNPHILLRTLGTFCYSLHFPSYNSDHYILNAILPFLAPSADRNLARFALNCAANMLMKSSRIAVDVSKALIKLLEELDPSCIGLQDLKVCATLLRAIHYMLPNVTLEDPIAIQSLLSNIYSLVCLGTPFFPGSDSNVNSPISSDNSDNDSGTFDDVYYGKIKFYGLMSIQSLFKKYPKAVFGCWELMFKGSLEHQFMDEPSLLHLLFHEKSFKTRHTVATTLAVVVEFSPLSKWQGTQTEASLGQTQLAQEIPKLIENLHSGLAYLLQTEVHPQFLAALLKAAGSLIDNTPYTHFDSQLLRKLCNAVMELWNLGDQVRGSVFSTLTLAFKSGNPELKDFISPKLVSWILESDEMVHDRLALLSKMIKGYPFTMETFHKTIESKLERYIMYSEPKLQAKAFEVIDEYIRAKPDCPVMPMVLEKVLVFIKHVKTESLVPALNTLSLFSNFSGIKTQSLSTLLQFLQQFENDPSAYPPLRCAVLKVVGALAKAQVIPHEFFKTALSIVNSHRKVTNLNVAINSSLAVSYFCLHPCAQEYIDEIISIIEENSLNRKEKVVSNAIIAAGNLFQTFDYQVYASQFPKLLEICIKGLPHKNAKVGWDACAALVKMFGNSSIKNSQVSSQLIPVLLDTIGGQPNFKTRISACQLLRNYKSELANYSIRIFQVLAEVLAAENNVEPLMADGTVLKYQQLFRQECLLTILHLINYIQSLCPAMMKSLSFYLVCIYEWLETLNLGEVEYNWVARSVQKLVVWIEKYEDITVSFGLFEDLKSLSDQYSTVASVYN